MGAVEDRLAIDEHSVAIEDDEIGEGLYCHINEGNAKRVISRPRGMGLTKPHPPKAIVP